MQKCEWCKSETKQIYTFRQTKGCLCPICAKKHFDSIEKKLLNHIEEVKKGISNRREALYKLTQAMCKHENLIDTCFGKTFPNGTNAPVIKAIWKCKDCDKRIYKELGGFSIPNI